jgi:hypothetical protein
MKKIFNEGNQIHNFMSSSGSGTVINYGSGSGSDFLTSYGSGYGSGSTSQKVTVPTVPVPVPVPQHCFTYILVLPELARPICQHIKNIFINEIWIWTQEIRAVDPGF